MARRNRLTDKGVRELQPKPSLYAFPDPELVGHYVRVHPSGARTFVCVARDPAGKQIWQTLDRSDALKIEDARELARKALKAIKAGEHFDRDDTFGRVAEQWLRRKVEPAGLRSLGDIERDLKNHIPATFSKRPMSEIRRQHIAKLLDTIEDDAGAVAADKVLAHISRICGWYATRHDSFTNPIVRGMRRSNPKDRARDRVLSDQELREIWRHAEQGGTFGALVQLLLLTGQRRQKVSEMQWTDIVAGVWNIPEEDRQKGTAGLLALPTLALRIIRSRPRYELNPHVLAGRGFGPFNSHSGAKEVFDAKLTGVEPWRLHDLRRTARSLMSRTGVQPHIAERVLGHSIKGVEGVYDRHAYFDEKADALRKLASLIWSIVYPQADAKCENCSQQFATASEAAYTESIRTGHPPAARVARSPSADAVAKPIRLRR